MKSLILHIFLLITSTTTLVAQSTSTEYLMLAHKGYPSKVGFPVGGKIKFKWHRDGLIHYETIVALSDTSFSFLENGNEIKTTVLFNEVARIYYPIRYIPVLSSSGNILTGGVMFNVIDVLNQLTSSRPVVINSTYATITAILIPFHILSYRLCHPSYRVSRKHLLKLVKVNKTVKSI